MMDDETWLFKANALLLDPKGVLSIPLSVTGSALSGPDPL
jgi:hypothetical protein